MDEAGFKQYLKNSGKKPHVVEGLVKQVQMCESFLMQQRKVGLSAVQEQDLQAYVQTLAPAEAKKQMRGLALYFQFTGNDTLARWASHLREQEIAQTRQAFKLREFRGVSLDAVTQLEALGIVTVEHMLAAGKTPETRKQLSRRAGIPLTAILELVKLSDLSRLGAVKGVRARLYYDAGLDTPDKFIQWDADALRQMLIEFVERTRFDGIAPLPKELQNAIARARQLPNVIQY